MKIIVKNGGKIIEKIENCICVFVFVWFPGHTKFDVKDKEDAGLINHGLHALLV